MRCVCVCVCERERELNYFQVIVCFKVRPLTHPLSTCSSSPPPQPHCLPLIPLLPPSAPLFPSHLSSHLPLFSTCHFSSSLDNHFLPLFPDLSLYLPLFLLLHPSMKKKNPPPPPLLLRTVRKALHSVSRAHRQRSRRLVQTVSESEDVPLTGHMH